MRIEFSKSAGNPRKVKKINALLKDCSHSPFEGMGQPEPLKHDWVGWWSRRIDQEHRLVYRITTRDGEQVLEIAQCRHHY